MPDGGPTIEVVDVLLDGRTPDELLARLLAENPRDERIGVSPQDLLAALRGEPAQDDGRVAIRECICTCEGCDPLRVWIRAGTDEVVWDDLTEGCLDDPVPEIAFRFDRAEHDRAIAALVADLEG
ncbi:hypothetical protein [Arsenicicoccus dermatophilus]|uniref:hypothetical protein n=1 Tax=Arsenicicoccus dermatophilus TaxID=1076331 RepID=UPI001F4C84AE|nr:hypothetical protein [Arsenicicoccus dermatophilus]MCH8612832.1 hypothetical protein [Arsenicicoccus dermatophilus]